MPIKIIAKNPKIMDHINSHAAVVFADIQGYTEIMAEDEKAGIAALDHFMENMSRYVVEHNGRLMHFWGDGCLALFDDASDALACCIQLQLKFQRDPMLPVRIGINCGDIIETECNAYGNAVNISSRVESISLPGSVLLTECVKRELSENHADKLLPLGKVDFKNMEGPIEVYAVEYKDLIVPDRAQFASEHGGQIPRRNFMQKRLWLWKSVVAALGLVVDVDQIIC